MLSTHLHFYGYIYVKTLDFINYTDKFSVFFEHKLGLLATQYLPFLQKNIPSCTKLVNV